MNYPETVILKESQEYKAAEALTDSINSMSWNPKKFGLAVSMQHRTLQQSLMKSFVAILHVMASDDYGYDDRNRGAHEAAKKMIESGILDDIYLPFILPMTYECCCSDITLSEWQKKMKGVKPINYKWLVNKIKKHIPQLYQALALDYYNPYENKCGVNQDYYILLHSSIEYFIKK